MNDPRLANQIGVMLAKRDGNGDIVSVSPQIYTFKLGVGDETGYADSW